MIVRFDRATVVRQGGVRALDDFSLSIAAGEIVALVGGSGAGKTTALKLVNRLLDPTTGDVIVEGRSTRDWDPIHLRRRIGYVFQDVGLFPHMTVAQNVGVIPRLEGWAADRIRERTAELLALVGLPPDIYANRLPAALSGGQRQRVGVARALAAGPHVLLMDEPFGALDPITRADLRREFIRIQQAVGTTVLIVTHDLAEAFTMASRIGVMHDSRLIACDTPEAMLALDDSRVRALFDAWPPRPPAVSHH